MIYVLVFHILELGRLTQLVEYLVYTEAVGGSSPSPPILAPKPSGFPFP